MKKLMTVCAVVMLVAGMAQADQFWGAASSEESANSSTAHDPVLFKLDTATGTVGTTYTYSNWRTILDVTCAPGNILYAVHSTTSDLNANKTFMLAKVDAATGAVLSDTAINTLTGTDLPAWNAMKYHNGKLYAVENSWRGGGSAEAKRGYVYEVGLNGSGDPISATLGAYIGGYPAPDGALAYKDGTWYASDWRDDAPHASSWIRTTTDIMTTNFTLDSASVHTEPVGYFDGWDFEADGDLLGVSWMASYGLNVYKIDLMTGNPTALYNIGSQLPSHIISFSGLTAALPIPTTWDVATVHGRDQFVISPDSTLLHYNQQGWTNYVWFNNNGSPAGTVATSTAGINAPLSGPRTGMRTFAATDVAVGQKLRDLKLVFDYRTALGYPTINFFMTDGAGKFGIFAPTSAGMGAVAQTQVLDADWTRVTIDLTQTSIADTTLVAVYEHNGLAADKVEPFTSMQWGDIKDLTIAGMYDYQRSPSFGWGYWGTMFDQVNTAGNAAVVNGHGLALIWGDTANSNNAYGSAQKEIRNVAVSFGGTDYVGTFANAQVPAPAPITVKVYASSAPNTGTAVWNGYVVNALNSLENGLGNIGDRATDPTAYEIAPEVVGPGEIAVTSFTSWRGAITPTGAFANEHGNRMHFGLHAIGDGTQQFRLEDLTFALHSSDDPWDSLVYVGDFIGYNYNGTTRYGISWGPDRIKGTADDVKYIAGNGTTPVDEIVYVGVGNAWWPGGGDPDPANPIGGAQAAMDDLFNWIASMAPDNVAVTCTYDILSWSGSDTVTVATDNVLKLDASPASLYIKPGGTVVIDMDALNLAQYVNGVQAVLNFSSVYFKAGAGEVDVQAGGGVWNEMIYNQWTTGGDLDVAVGVDVNSLVGTRANGTVAKFTLTANAVEGTTQMVFRPDVSDVENTMFSDINSQFVVPGGKVNSQDIVIDGTVPTIGIADDLGTDPVLQGTYTITVTASDALSGLAGAPLVKLDGNVLTPTSGSGPWIYTVVVNAATTNGVHNITADISDLAGNPAVQATRSFTVNKNQITGTVSMGFVGTGTRVVTFVLNGTVTMTASVDKVGGYKLTNVIDGVTAVSAKTAWTLRQKQSGLATIDGQTVANFSLRGGDLNGTNSINILDFSILKNNWFTANSVADINGDGRVSLLDLVILKNNWFQAGNPQ